MKTFKVLSLKAALQAKKVVLISYKSADFSSVIKLTLLLDNIFQLKIFVLFLHCTQIMIVFVFLGKMEFWQN